MSGIPLKKTLIERCIISLDFSTIVIIEELSANNVWQGLYASYLRSENIFFDKGYIHLFPVNNLHGILSTNIGRPL